MGGVQGFWAFRVGALGLTVEVLGSGLRLVCKGPEPYKPKRPKADFLGSPVTLLSRMYPFWGIATSQGNLEPNKVQKRTTN